MTAGDAGIKITPVQYMNSGDSKFGDHAQCVGYWSIAITRTSAAQSMPSAEFNFTKEEKKTLLGIARSTIVMYINENKLPKWTIKFQPQPEIHAGAFVTLKNMVN